MAITPRYRAFLALKALLLLALSLLFEFLGAECWSRFHWELLARISGAALCGIAALSIAWAAVLGFSDAILGQAVTTSGAKPLKSRRSGYSLKLPNGKFVEYVLYNPWPKLDPNQSYTVTYGRYSRVMVAEPTPDAAGAN